jgi:ATP-dependent DNA helicase 2 subunit 1
MNKIKGMKKPGISLIGFKPKGLIKPYHNLRPSYFLYPDEEHVTGSSQFFDALID